MKFYRVTLKPEVAISGARRFWLRVIKENDRVVIGWELGRDGERTHRQHIIDKNLATFEVARMDRTYGTMELE
jgi:hypothetical protein